MSKIKKMIGSRREIWGIPNVNIQFKGHLVSFGYSERINELYGQYDKLRKINNSISLTNIFLFNMQCAKIHEFVHKCNVSQYLTPET